MGDKNIGRMEINKYVTDYFAIGFSTRLLGYYQMCRIYWSLPLSISLNSTATHRSHEEKNTCTYPFALINTAIASIAVLSVSTPISLSRVIVVITYMGGAISLIFTGASATLLLSPSRSASLMASMPSYVKQVTSMSALIFTGWGASLLLTYDTTAVLVSSSTSSPSNMSSSDSLVDGMDRGEGEGQWIHRMFM